MNEWISALSSSSLSPQGLLAFAITISCNLMAIHHEVKRENRMKVRGERERKSPWR